MTWRMHDDTTDEIVPQNDEERAVTRVFIAHGDGPGIARELHLTQTSRDRLAEQLGQWFPFGRKLDATLLVPSEDMTAAPGAMQRWLRETFTDGTDGLSAPRSPHLAHTHVSLDEHAGDPLEGDDPADRPEVLDDEHTPEVEAHDGDRAVVDAGPFDAAAMIGGDTDDAGTRAAMTAADPDGDNVPELRHVPEVEPDVTSRVEDLHEQHYTVAQISGIVGVPIAAVTDILRDLRPTVQQASAGRRRSER